DRLDPLDCGHRRNPAVTDLLVLVGRPRLLQPPPDVLRRGPRRTGRRRALLNAGRAKSCALRPGAIELRAPEIAIPGALRAEGTLGCRVQTPVPSRASRLRVLTRWSAAS